MTLTGCQAVNEELYLLLHARVLTLRCVQEHICRVIYTLTSTNAESCRIKWKFILISWPCECFRLSCHLLNPYNITDAEDKQHVALLTCFEAHTRMSGSIFFPTALIQVTLKQSNFMHFLNVCICTNAEKTNTQRAVVHAGVFILRRSSSLVPSRAHSWMSIVQILIFWSGRVHTAAFWR